LKSEQMLKSTVLKSPVMERCSKMFLQGFFS
jgi:hypothetical protein